MEKKMSRENTQIVLVEIAGKSKRVGYVAHRYMHLTPMQWKLLDLVPGFLFLAVFIFFLCVSTQLGDLLVASGRQSFVLSEGRDIKGYPQYRRNFIRVVESGEAALEAFPC
jgi:hypothetical protein